MLDPTTVRFGGVDEPDRCDVAAVHEPGRTIGEAGIPRQPLVAVGRPVAGRPAPVQVHAAAVDPDPPEVFGSRHDDRVAVRVVVRGDATQRPFHGCPSRVPESERFPGKLKKGLRAG